MSQSIVQSFYYGQSIKKSRDRKEKEEEDSVVGFDFCFLCFLFSFFLSEKKVYSLLVGLSCASVEPDFIRVVHRVSTSLYLSVCFFDILFVCCFFLSHFVSKIEFNEMHPNGIYAFFWYYYFR